MATDRGTENLADEIIGAGWTNQKPDEWLLTGSGRPGEYDVLVRARQPSGVAVQPRLLATGLSYDQANTLVVEHNYPLMTIQREQGQELVSSMADFQESAHRAITGAGHEPDDNPTIWLRHIQSDVDISDDQAWGLLLLQVAERLREMRHGVIHSDAKRPIWMTLRIELA